MRQIVVNVYCILVSQTLELKIFYNLPNLIPMLCFPAVIVAISKLTAYSSFI